MWRKDKNGNELKEEKGRIKQTWPGSSIILGCEHVLAAGVCFRGLVADSAMQPKTVCSSGKPCCYLKYQIVVTAAYCHLYLLVLRGIC